MLEIAAKKVSIANVSEDLLFIELQLVFYNLKTTLWTKYFSTGHWSMYFVMDLYYIVRNTEISGFFPLDTRSSQ